MSMQTITFDPNRIITVADIARMVGVSHQSALKYLERHADEFPPPLFTLTFAGRQLPIWSQRDGQALAAEYTMRRAVR
jgi:hypothetical protein